MRVEFDPQAGPKDPPRRARRQVLDRARARTLGVYRELENGGGRVPPIDKRGAAREIFIPTE